MSYEDFVKEQEKLLCQARKFLNDCDFDSFNKKMDEYNLLADKYLEQRKGENKNGTRII